MNALKRVFCLGLCATAVLVGCSKDKADKPAVLVPLVNRIDIKRVWHDKLSGERPILRLGLGVAVEDQRAFAASYKGTVVAYESASGKELWQRSVHSPLSAGPAVANGLLVVGSSKGDVIALSPQDGAPRWRVRINAEILSAAAIGAGLVVVRGVDGKLHGLSAKDGSENWVVDQQVPRLSLRGTSRPILVGDLIVCGFDNGRVVGVAAGNGSTAWETSVGQSHGSTELQRLIDVDASVVVEGDDLFAVAYQGRVARLSRENGQIVWARDLSSFRGLTVDANAVYVATAEGDLVRLDRRTGTEQWRQKSLQRRQLSQPILYRGRIVVADLAGFVHWFDAATGDPIARVSIGKKQRISTPLVVAGDLLLIFSDEGELTALRAPGLEAK
ncbi:MAG TPA: outer membrane protein assembly factor BamB [Steroidobacteraceae bacterium]|nr:outer membrane protein assembly factor BamB [Steroidobacteraceae bacterium]